MDEKMSLLIVDDREDNLTVLASLVKEYLPLVEIFKANSAVDALRIAADKHIDGALIDVQMPEIDGIELCKRLKAEERTSLIRIILITSHKTTAELRSRGLEAGADDFIHRPFDNIEFVARLKVLFRLKHSEDKLREANEQLEELSTEKIAELRESERHLRAVFAAADNVAFVTTDLGDKDTQVLSFSLGAEKIFGYTAKEIIGQKVALLHPPEEIGNFQTMQQALRNDKKGFSGEATLIRKSGEHFPGLFTLHPLHNDTGEMIGTLGVTIDIKERKRLENIQAVQLRLIEYASGHTIDELLQKLLDEAETLTGSEIGFYHFVDDDQTNLSLQSWSTNTKEKMCTENIDDRHYPINQAGVWVDCVHQRRPVIHNDYASLPHKKGIPEGHAPIIRELVVPVIRGEKIVAILGVGNKKENYGQEDAKKIQLLADLAWETIVQKQAANELRESNSRYSDLIEKMSSGFALHKVVYAKNGTVEDYLFLDMNTAFEALTGLKRAETIGKTVRQVLPQTEGFWIERFGEVALTGVPKHFNDYSKALGKYYDVTAYCPAPQQFATIINDISDQKMAEDEIGRLNDELEERVKQRTAELELSNQELEAFSYSVSHDLRAPLRAINGKAGMLEEELAGMSSAPARKHLRSIRKSSQMMGQLVDDLILYARLSKLVSKSDTVNLDDIVQSCWKESAAEREGRNIDFQSSMLPPCHGDRAMLKQLIINLMSNAVKYTGSREQAIIEIGSREEDGKTVYFMRDNGIGFDMRYIDKLFNVFQRLHREDEYEGTGIGLSLAKRIVERHGGRIWAEGEVGKGATFYFTLEASHPSQP